MKKLIFLSICFILIGVNSFGQTFEKPSDGKSLIYFIRFSGTGALINFKYFDGNEYLGKMNGVNYFIYECDPGEHVFWVAAENRDYIKGELKSNFTYVIEVRPTIGAFKSSVRLYPVSPDDEKTMKKVYKIMKKRLPTELKDRDDDMAFFIKNGLERYAKIKNEVKLMNSNWTF